MQGIAAPFATSSLEPVVPCGTHTPIAGLCLSTFDDDFVFGNFVPVEGKEFCCPETGENLDGDSWKDGSRGFQQESRHLFGREDANVGIRERWFLNVCRRVLGGPAARDGEVEKNVSNPAHN